MIYFCSFLLLLCGLINYAFYRDGLAPGVMQPVLWGLLLAGASTVQDTYFYLSQETLFLCVVASLLFQAGFFVCSHMTPCVARYTTSATRSSSLRFRNVMFWLVLLFLPFYVKTAYTFATSGPVNDMAINLRYALSDERPGYGIAAYGVTMSLFLVMLESKFVEAGKKWRLAATIMIAAVFCVLLTGRTFILALLICFLFPQIITGKMRASRGFLLLFAIFLPAYYLYSVSFGKDGGGGFASMADVFKLYLYGGLFAFDKLTLDAAPLENGDNLFRFFRVALGFIDPSITVAPLVDSYEFIPEPTNVYTVFGKAFRDFGTAGVAVYLLFIGAMHGFVYARARLGSMYYQILLVFSYFALLMQFFQDQYLGMLSTWGQVIILTGLFAVFIRSSHGKRIRAPFSSPAAQQQKWPLAQQAAQRQRGAR
jgi:oligosaccharide repeat unit polymerase